MARQKRTRAELEAASSREQIELSGDGRSHIEGLLADWVEVAGAAMNEIRAETSVSIVNAGDQVQKHPATTVLEAASKRIEALVVLLDRMPVEGDGKPELPDGAPAAFKPKVVE